MGRARSGNVRINPPADGLVCAPLKPHSRDKLLILGYCLEEFARAMHRKYPNLVYLDLFGGPGRGRFDSGETIDGSPLIAARTVPNFTKIIAAEADPENAAALEQRLRAECGGRPFKVFNRDCNEIATDLRAEIPAPKWNGTEWVEGTLTFCLADPFNLGIHLSTLAEFKALKIDFLVLIADQMAGGRAEDALVRPDSRIVELFLNDADWRAKWEAAAAAGEPFREFLHREFTRRMLDLGFLAGAPHRVKVAGKGVKLYQLGFFSKHPLGITFWEQAIKNAPTQGKLFV